LLASILFADAQVAAEGFDADLAVTIAGDRIK
jgi:hypothetical protein